MCSLSKSNSMKFSITIVLVFFSFFSNGQQFLLKNASFEGTAHDAVMPAHWMACKAGSTPDILPGFWDVNLDPSDGETYVGLITREDKTYESIGQKIQTLKKSQCFAFSVNLAHSNAYAGYNLPVRFRVWAGKSACKKDQLIGEVGIVGHEDWKTYDFSFVAEQDINFIIIEAYYVKGMLYDYRGNILVDKMTPFTNCDRAEIHYFVPNMPLKG